MKFFILFFDNLIKIKNMSLNFIPHNSHNSHNSQTYRPIKTYGPLNPLQREVIGNRELAHLIKAAKENYIESFTILVKHVKAINLQDPRINALLDVIPESMEGLPLMELINKQDSHGNTMLHYAVINGDLALVKRLDQFGAEVSLTNYFGWTAFDYAVQQKNVELFQYLMKYHQINFHDTNIRDKFVELACKGSKDAIEFLIDKWKSLRSPEDLDCYKNILKSCFLNAATFAHPEICMLLIEFDRLNEKLINSLDHNGQSALHLAAIYGEFEICKLILDSFNKDFNPLLNHKDYDGKTAVDYALDDKNLDIFNLLVQYGAHFSRHDQRLSDLLVIAVDLLVIAADKYDLDSSKYLTNIIKISLDSQLQNTDTQYLQNKLKTAFHTACSNGFDDLVRYFLNDDSIKDIVIGTIDTLGQSGLHLATINNRKGIVNMLIPHSELLNLQDNQGNTALHYGAFRKYSFIYDLLICFGADDTIKNNNYETPADLMKLYFQSKVPRKLKPSRAM